MKTNCLVILVVFSGLVAIYIGWLGTVWDPPSIWIVAPFLAILTSAAIGGIKKSRDLAADLSRVRNALHGLPPRDGQIGAALGTIHAEDGLLETPFSQEPCVIYEYEIYHGVDTRTTEGRQHRRIDDYSGYAMSPCYIRMQSGDHRVLGFPNLQGFEASQPGSLEEYACAHDYVWQGDFEDLSANKLSQGLAVVRDLIASVEGPMKKDYIIAADGERMPLPPILIHEDGTVEDEWERASFPTLSETKVADGETVCAIGMYSIEKKGFVPAVGSHGVSNRLIRGEPEQIQRHLSRKTLASGIGSVLALATIHLAVVGAMWAYRSNPDVRRDLEQELAKQVTDGNIERVETLLNRGVDANRRNISGETPLMLAKDVEVARQLVEHGGDIEAQSESGQTPLMEAARRGRADIVSLLIEKGADVSARDHHDRTALMQAASNGHENVVLILQQADPNP